MRAVLFAFTAAQLQVGMKIPPSEMHLGFPPTTINIAERVAGKKVVLVGLPGAFTPT
jgi:peroxiredoxin